MKCYVLFKNNGVSKEFVTASRNRDDCVSLIQHNFGSIVKNWINRKQNIGLYELEHCQIFKPSATAEERKVILEDIASKLGEENIMRLSTNREIFAIKTGNLTSSQIAILTAECGKGMYNLVETEVVC